MLSRLFVQIFLFHSTEKLAGEPFSVSENFGYRKILCIREGGGRVSRFFVENFLSHSTEKLRWGTLRCIRKFRVSKNFMHQRGGGGITFLRQKLFVSQYRKISLGNTLVFQKISCIAKFYASERGCITFFVENFLSHSTEKLRWGTLRCIRKFRVSKNFMHQRGGGVSRFFVKNFLSHSTEKLRWGTLRCIRKFRVSKNFMHQRGGGGITFLRQKLFVSQYRKIPLGNTLVFQKILCIAKFYA